MALIDVVRPQPARDFLLCGAYHTPNGHLHLGHLGGPFLNADAMARHLETLEHRVTRISSTDAYEAYVLLASQLENRSPTETAAYYWAAARDVLAGFDLHYDTFMDFGADPWKRAHHEQCHEIATFMEERQRLTVAPVKIPRTRSGRFALGPFVLGRCPHCGADAAGTACETCGMWFGPADLNDARARLETDPIVTRETVPTVYLRVSDELTPELVDSRFPPGYSDLLEHYLHHNEKQLHITHPLGWGVRWRAHPMRSEVVHVSYGTGSYAATVVTGHEYQRLTDAPLSPFHRESAVTTILTGGYDAALPCMMVIALKDRESDFDPFRHHVMNRFMLLDGHKFSTTMGHVVLGSTYLDAGLSPDLFRLYAAQLAPPHEEGNFVLGEFSTWAAEFIEARLNRTVIAALGRLATGSGLGALESTMTSSMLKALGDQASALSLPSADLCQAAGVLSEWLTTGEATLAASSPYWWLKTLAILAYPFMPRWSTDLWLCLGASEIPSIGKLEQLTDPEPDAYVPMAGVSAGQLAKLEYKGGDDDG